MLDLDCSRPPGNLRVSARERSRAGSSFSRAEPSRAERPNRQRRDTSGWLRGLHAGPWLRQIDATRGDSAAKPPSPPIKIERPRIAEPLLPDPPSTKFWKLFVPPFLENRGPREEELVERWPERPAFLGPCSAAPSPPPSPPASRYDDAGGSPPHPSLADWPPRFSTQLPFSACA